MDMRVDQGESDEALASAAAGGDRAAFALLVGRHYDFVFRIAWRWLGRREEAEDLTQDVCVRLGRAIASFRGEAAFSTWLYQLTLNALRDRQRAASRQRRGEQALFAQALVEPAHAEPAPDDAGETLWAAVRQLPEKTRDAVL
ncbi:MAG TPA: sigma-70 family RNA polymerase sigma factor, partial [Rhizobiaceae bacterium]|nr:sigma-70 family RNA polymerase sigma factor [Rhizobiaceae bacterium]